MELRYNPVLGEFFRCRYDYDDGTQGFYIAEQGEGEMSCDHFGDSNEITSIPSPPHFCVFLHIPR